MCGIFSFIVGNKSEINNNQIKEVIRFLMIYSETRGKDASGIAIKNDHEINILKYGVSASKLIKTSTYKSLISESLNRFSGENRQISILGHCRLATNGDHLNNNNNQPVYNNSIICVHNGIITNINEINKVLNQYDDYELDTEYIIKLTEDNLSNNFSLLNAFIETSKRVNGGNAFGQIFSKHNSALFTTSFGSIYYCIGTKNQVFLLASEEIILKKIIVKKKFQGLFDGCEIKRLSINDIIYLNIDNFCLNLFNINDNITIFEEEKSPVKINEYKLKDSEKNKFSRKKFFKNYDPDKIHEEIESHLLLDDCMIRCKKCLLPESFPYIEFDDDGICNYCRNYEKIKHYGREQLENDISKYRRNGNQADCIVLFSGGRDSSYMLHYLKTELGLNPIAFTYDWGMVTDLARRNISRVCGDLGIENIIYSADITKKREFVRLNLEAWLKKPELGMVPLLMAGDKQFLSIPYKLSKDLGIKLLFNGANPLEKTEFKIGFCGLQEDDTRGKGLLKGTSNKNKLRLAQYYFVNYLKNPRYINSSIFDTLDSFKSVYMLPDNYMRFYHYIPWNEEVIESTLIKNYDWETATDTATTWRIGDGTASFYNYIYYTIAGFSENDTFRSNQIREGMLTRNEALDIVKRDNRPRVESLIWYANTIGFDLEKALKIIHNTKKYWMMQR